MALRTLIQRLRRRSKTGVAAPQHAGAMPRRHSVSSCREYELCPRRYRYSYVERLKPDRPAPDFWRYGTVVHRALEAAYNERSSGAWEPTMEKSALAALDEAWTDERMPDDAAWRDRAEQMVRRAIADDLLYADDILGVEHRFSARFDSTTAFAGCADLVLRRDDHTVEIVDHKTTSTVLDARTLQCDQQLNLYGWLAKNEWPWATHIIATHHYPPAAATTTVELTDESMGSTMRVLADTARRATADVEFLPTPGAHCGHCSWAPRCPAAMTV